MRQANRRTQAVVVGATAAALAYAIALNGVVLCLGVAWGGSISGYFQGFHRGIGLLLGTIVPALAASAFLFRWSRDAGRWFFAGSAAASFAIGGVTGLVGTAAFRSPMAGLLVAALAGAIAAPLLVE